MHFALKAGRHKYSSISPVPKSHAAPPSAMSSRITAVTYNILANKYCVSPKLQDTGDIAEEASGWYKHCDVEHLVWKTRQKRILGELETYQADIVCLQEVEEEDFVDSIQPWFQQHGYDGLYYRRQNPELLRGAPAEGVALFYRTSLFDAAAVEKVRFSSCTLPGLPAVHHTPNEPRNSCWSVFQQREEGAVLALLKYKVTGRLILVASTHLFWSPRYPDVKALQASALCYAIQKFLHKMDSVDIPVVIGGDFNSTWPHSTLLASVTEMKEAQSLDVSVIPAQTPQPAQKSKRRESWLLSSGVYTLLDQGLLPSSHLDHPSSLYIVKTLRPGEAVNRDFAKTDLSAYGLQLSSAHMLAHSREPPFTHWTQNFAACLDYIWVSSKHFKVVGTLSLPYMEPVFDMQNPLPEAWRNPKSIPFGPIPNEAFPSDHLAVGAILDLL